MAQSLTSRFDPDDLVSEAYTRILDALARGGGPQGAFRPYLFVTIRNVAIDTARSSREDPWADTETLEDPRFSEAQGLANIDRRLAADAFRALPTRWQELLWYVDVEGKTPQQLAPELQTTPSAVAAMTYRAREGLRRSWIQVHLDQPEATGTHHWVISRLGAWVRGGLSSAVQQRIEAHLADCTECAAIAEEACHVGRRLLSTLRPEAPQPHQPPRGNTRPPTPDTAGPGRQP
jgi:RNA polymerase sigma factor (sigma-70 family)